MLGRQERWPEDLFVAGPLRDLIPDEHILKRVDRVLDLSGLRAEVHTCYQPDQGRPGIDPEAAVRLMLAGLFQGLTADRKLLRETQVNLAIRWFAGPAVSGRQKISRTDPDAARTTGGAPQRLEPSYKQHTTVNDQAETLVGVAVRTVTADGAYAHPRNYEHLEQRDGPHDHDWGRLRSPVGGLLPRVADRHGVGDSP